ncbi:MAG: LamG domain-containing protein [Armatimonadetes bacterium]|nr:LamG domain-containing protein [Armatimonadota bacterium]
MTTLALIAAVSLGHRAPLMPVAWFPLQGKAVDVLRGTEGRLEGDARFLNPNGPLDLAGRNGCAYFADEARFGMDASFSVSAQVFVRTMPSGGTSPAGQIVFRGDDRGGLDNYCLSLGYDGLYSICFDGPEGPRVEVKAHHREQQWQQLLGTYDARYGLLSLYVDGVLAAQTATTVLPVARMEAQYTPGLSIGNVQNPLGGCHNQPFNGMIRDVRIYNQAIFPDDLDRVPKPVDR